MSKFNDSKMEFDAVELIAKGKQLCNSNQVKLGIKCFETSLLKGINDDELIMAVHHELGNAYFSIKDYDNAIAYYVKNLNLAKAKGDIVVESVSNGHISSVLKMLGRFDEAIVHCEHHLKTSRNLNNKSEISKALYNMGNILYDDAKSRGAVARQDIGEFPPDIENLLENAANCYKESLKTNKKLNNSDLHCKILGNYANIHFLLNNFKKAIKLNTEKLKITRDLNDKDCERRTLVNRGNVYAVIKNYESAIQDFKSALDIAKTLKDISSEIKILYTIANTYFIVKEYPNAEEYMLQYLSIVKNMDIKTNEARANQCLSIIYSEMGNARISRVYAKQYRELCKELQDEYECQVADENLKRLDDIVNYSDEDGLRSTNQSNLIILPATSKQLDNINMVKLPNVIDVESFLNNTMDRTVDKPSETVKAEDDSGSDEFYALLAKYQMRKLKEQSINFDHNSLQEHFDNYISSSKKIFIDIVNNVQGRRMDDQRREMPFYSNRF